MDLFDWLLEYGDVLSAAVIVRLVTLCIILEFIGILVRDFKDIAR